MSQAKFTLSLAVPDRDRVRDYALASNDRNPLHLDADAARTAGFPDVLAHGMLIMGQALSALRIATGANAVVQSKVRFRAPVTVGTALTMACERDGTDFAFEVSGEDDITRISGTATLKWENGL